MVDANDPAAQRAAVAKALRSDNALTSLLTSAIRYSPTIFDVTIADSEGRGLLSTDPTNLDHLVPQRPEYEELESGGLLRLLEAVFGPPRVYNLTLPLERGPETFATVRVGVRTTFLRFVVEPWLIAALDLYRRRHRLLVDLRRILSQPGAATAGTGQRPPGRAGSGRS